MVKNLPHLPTKLREEQGLEKAIWKRQVWILPQLLPLLALEGLGACPAPPDRNLLKTLWTKQGWAPKAVHAHECRGSMSQSLWCKAVLLHQEETHSEVWPSNSLIVNCVGPRERVFYKVQPCFTFLWGHRPTWFHVSSLGHREKGWEVAFLD